MANLLLELFSEEIPARMQARAEAQLGEALGKALTEAGLGYDALETLSGPRRLTVSVTGLPEKSADVREERKGPKVGAPDKAVAGFLRGAGLDSIDQAEVRTDPKKGDFYVAVIETPGRAAAEIIAEAVPEIVRGFHWPKSMRWGTGDLRWVRPLQRILCVLDGKTVPFDVDGIASGNQTEGHRTHGRGPYTITGLEDYRHQLEGDGHVILDRIARKNLIAEQAARLCKDAGLELVGDIGLLEEVAGLAEWPVVILGDMDPAFLELPAEVIRLSMRTHQKYFAVRDPKTGALAPHFVVVANITAPDGGKTIAAGNAKVLSARLEDARFFWENDKKTGLEAMAPKLASIDFKKELGSVADKVERVAALARELAPAVGADPDLAEKAARLAKADLVSEMVYEFPELQGVMGRYYALAADTAALTPNPSPADGRGEQTAPQAPPSDITQIADAIADHYQPLGPSNPVPTAPVSIAVALADKLDTLVGFWAIDEKPTGSKDPFALRRAALGVVRIVLENGVRLGLRGTALYHCERLKNHFQQALSELPLTTSTRELGDLKVSDQTNELSKPLLEGLQKRDVETQLLAFFADRLKQHLRDKGERHDLIDAVFDLGEDDLVLITKRVAALGAFLDTEDGTNLLAGYKRAANILRAEEKKDGVAQTGEVDVSLLTEAAERDLHTAITGAVSKAEAAITGENFEAAMVALATLRTPVDKFFDEVTVNADDPAVRANRLRILTGFRESLHKVANFAKIET